MRSGMIWCTVLLMLTACSDPKKANDANFTKVIDAYLKTHPLCIDAPSSYGAIKPVGYEHDRVSFPMAVRLPATPLDQSLFAASTKDLDALASAGLLTAKTGTISTNEAVFSGPATIRTQPVKLYALTDLGQKALVHPDPTSDEPLGSLGDRFCYGTPHVETIKLFTEPSPVMGATVSSVDYTYSLKSKAAWATTPALQAAYPILQKTTADSVAGKTTLVLTNKGWIDTRATH